jgi:hypothetical protein
MSGYSTPATTKVHGSAVFGLIKTDRAAFYSRLTPRAWRFLDALESDYDCVVGGKEVS